jgi:hypothetical protein
VGKRKKQLRSEEEKEEEEEEGDVLMSCIVLSLQEHTLVQPN